MRKMFHLTKEMMFFKTHNQYFDVAANQSHLFILNANEGEGSCNLSFSAPAAGSVQPANGEGAVNHPHWLVLEVVAVQDGFGITRVMIHISIS